MVLDFLKQNPATLEINVAPQGTHKPGDILQAQVSVGTKDELKIRSCRIALYGETRCQVRSRTRTQKGTTTSYHWESNREEYSGQVVMEAGVYPAQFHQSFTVNLQIPKDAPPTAPGNIVQVVWVIKATLDRPNAPDVNAEYPILVAHAFPEGLSTKVQDPIECTDCDTQDADISMWIPRTEWALGETIEGRLSILANKDVKFSDVRVELVQLESVPLSAGNESSTAVSAGVDGKTVMTAGQSLTFPFKIAFPIGGAPTLDAGNGSIYWRLKGVFARSMATDYHIEKGLEVYSQS